MSITEAIILGTVQGLTEFLPVSSSGHLVLLQYIFGISDSNLFLTVMLHLGSLIAVIAVFYKDIVDLILHPLSKRCMYVLIATAVTGTMYVLLDDYVDTAFGGSSLWIGFLYSALLLYFAGSPNCKECNTLNSKKALIIGVMQGIALFPGVSRSGSTIAGGLVCGCDKEEISRFSFILSIPAILGGLLSEIGDISLSGIQWTPVLIATIVSAICAYLAIRFMLKILEKKRLSIFTPYLIMMSIISLIVI